MSSRQSLKINSYIFATTSKFYNWRVLGNKRSSPIFVLLEFRIVWWKKQSTPTYVNPKEIFASNIFKDYRCVTVDIITSLSVYACLFTYDSWFYKHIHSKTINNQLEEKFTISKYRIFNYKKKCGWVPRKSCFHTFFIFAVKTPTTVVTSPKTLNAIRCVKH